LKEGFNFNKPLGLEALDSQPRIAIHMVHRLGVLVATIYVLGLSIFLLKTPFYEINQVARVLMSILFIRMIFLAYAGYLQDIVFLTIVYNLGGLTLLLVLAGLAVKMTYVSNNNFN
jgi:heme A synthase